MRIELDDDEAAALLDTVMHRLMSDVDLSAADRAALTRWRADTMRPGREGSRVLLEKLNTDLGRVLKAKQRSQIQKHDWV